MDYKIGFKNIIFLFFAINLVILAFWFAFDYGAQNGYILPVVSSIVLSILIISFILVYHKKFINKIEKMQEDLKIANNGLNNFLYHDTLTNLPNRFSLEKDIKNISNPKIFVIRIDDYINILSYYGKKCYNDILIVFAKAIQEFGKQNDMATYKISENKFALLQDSDLFFDDYEIIAREIVAKFKGFNVAMSSDDKKVDAEISCTIGFCIEKEDTLNKAIIALNEASLVNKDFLCYFENISDIHKYKTRVEHATMIQNAILDNKVVPYYQAIFDKDKNVIKYESLVRIISDKHGIILPGIFLKDSKHIKRYTKIEKILIEKSMMNVKNNPNVTVSINLNIRDMTDGDVSAFVIDKLHKLQIGNQIIFEILEDEKMLDSQRVDLFLDKVRKMGVKIAIDDFGSGYSNFSYLLKIQPDYLKIDGSIVKNIDTDEKSYAIVRAIVAFAKELNIKTIAEYVHSKEVFDKCVQIGVDEFQGFYLSEPKDKFLD
ncbi:diguanylate cyclase/phosphodiesterase [Campylobacter iguaniorum]|uniref:Diguanylate cyclase/phosphodiesterase n=1 Tax=Campylobacter iguaniorum TaxID=1244531 RepID=A0A076FFD1_9BACT|nr:GGDEF domain-containing phosphodiesterase [Campylobacter iguaniorum]AII14564.1 diguanylate cyclase/phosphodiesterase [Campylobacter iguaniorum]